jgi:hypothetical protein
MSSKIIAHLKDRSGHKYKIEEVKKSGFLGDHSYIYHVSYNDNDQLYRNFKSRQKPVAI